MSFWGLGGNGLSGSDTEFVQMFLDEVAQIMRLPQRLRKEVLNSFEKVQYEEKDKIVSAGDQADKFFIVGSGAFVMYAPEINEGKSLLNTFETGDFIGESVFFRDQEARFPFDVTCTQGGHMFELSMPKFREIIENIKSRSEDMLPTDADKEIVLKEIFPVPKEKGENNRRSVMRASTISVRRNSLTAGGAKAAGSKEMLALVTRLVNSGQVLVGQEGVPTGPSGKGSDGFLIVLMGTLTLQLPRPKKSDESDSSEAPPSIKFMVGDMIGESELARLTWESEPSLAAIPDVSDVVFMRLGAEFRPGIPSSISWCAEVQTLFKIMHSIEAFQTLTPPQLERILRAGKYKEYAAGDAVSLNSKDAGGDTGKQVLYVIIHGVARITRPKEGEAPELLGRLGVGEHFGAINIVNPDAPRATDVHADTALRCFTLDRNDFGSLIETVKQSLARELANRRWVLDNRNKIMLKDLKVMKTIGVGTFGRVKLTTHATTEKLYALKCLQKKEVEEQRQVENVAVEAKLLYTCSHPQVLKLAAAFQDQKALYMVLEFIQGGELASLMEKKEELDLDHTRFYVGSIVNAFVYLYSMNIAYRDLKPENIMLTAAGELRIIDLGFTKILSEGRTFTFCGTAEYMAPEILRHCGYTLAVDWWALGIVMLEMMTGVCAFIPVDDEDPDDVLGKIMRYADGDKSILVIPDDIDDAAADFIRKLVCADPKKRMDAEEAPYHAFLQGIDFIGLEKGSVTPPYVPKIKDSRDTSHFKDFYDDDDEEESDHTSSKAYPGFLHTTDAPGIDWASKIHGLTPQTKRISEELSDIDPRDKAAAGGGGCCVVQ
jgi:serine/threonine protein kinase